jgi:hypothetical protein
MTNYRSVFWLNSLSLVLVIALTLYARFFGPSVGWLFLPAYPDVGLLTHTFQILCAAPVMVCAFTWGLLRIIQPGRQENLFILCSALIMGGFLINEIFRIHIILLGSYGIPKLVTIFVYGILVFSYSFIFWQRIIKSTPYVLLFSAVGLLFFAIAIDSLHLSGDGTPNLLEGVPKLFFMLNVAIYYWYVCQQEILKAIAGIKKSPAG